MRTRATLLLRASRAIDAVLIAAILAWFDPLALRASAAGILLTALIVPFWLILLGFVVLYESQRVETIAGVVRKLLTGHTLGCAVLIPVSWLVQPVWYPADITSSLAVTGICLLLEKTVVYAFLHLLRTRGIDLRNVCVVSDWRTAEELT